MTEKKVKKMEVLKVVKAFMEENADQIELTDKVKVEDVIAYCDTTITQLEAKREKAVAKAAEKKATGDVLKGKILAVMNSMEPDRFATADEILEAVNDEDATKSKIVARLSQLVKEGIVVKELVKLDEGKRMSYKLA